MKFLKVLFFLVCVVATMGVYAQSSDQLKRDRPQLKGDLKREAFIFSAKIQNPSGIIIIILFIFSFLLLLCTHFKAL